MEVFYIIKIIYKVDCEYFKSSNYVLFILVVLGYNFLFLGI